MSVNQQHTTYSRADIEKYLQGKMPTNAMHALERNALQDPFLADAIEGYRFADSQTTFQNLAEIETNILSQEADTKIVSVTNKKRHWVKIAASIIFIAGVGWIGFLLINTNNDKAIASNEKVKQTVAAENSVNTTDTNLHQNIVTENKLNPATEIIRQPKSIAKVDNSNNNLRAASLDEVSVSVPFGTLKKSSTACSISMAAMDIAKQDTASTTNTLDSKTAGVAASEARLEQVAATNFASKKMAAQPSKIKSNKDDSLLIPLNGWAGFNDYLVRNNRSIVKNDSVSSLVNNTNSKKGEEVVGLEFEVDKNGTPTNIKVTKSVDKPTDAKAIELLKNGPKWTNHNSNNNNQKAKIEIKVQ
jgi:Gram-negative bacterial TonB protein C-terminal